LRDRVGEALVRTGRKENSAIVVAVASTATPDALRTLVELGHRDYGETRPNALVQRAVAMEEFLGRRRFLSQMGPKVQGPKPLTKEDIRWHVVGPVPRQKARQIIPLVRLIHSVDSLRLAEELHSLGARMEPRHGGDVPRPVPILLRINITGDDKTPGIAPPAARHLAEQINTMVHLELRGLMSSPPRGTSEDEAKHIFTRCNELFDDISTSGIAGPRFNLLSMGDSDNFEVALEAGANVVRIGRGLFGENEDAPDAP
jgi:pyridoxal phosphate enzyme (YggS family)